MRAALLIAAVAAAAVCIPADDAVACGDKFLVTGRGVRYQGMQPSTRPASVLLYMRPGSSLSEAARSVDLKKTLELAGHGHTAVSTDAELREALASGKFDVVVADVADAPKVSEILGDSPTAPALLPVVHDGSRAEKSAARKAFGRILTTPARGSRYVLAAVDRAVRDLDKRSRIAAKSE